MKRKTVLLLASACLALGSAALWADAPHVRMVANDPAFDSLIDQDLLHEAAFGNDAGEMVDAAIMLERAEQQLHRPHRGGTADDMYRNAWRTAKINHDDNALERIKQHLEYYQRNDFYNELQNMEVDYPEPAVRPRFNGSDRDMYEDMMQHAENALQRLDQRAIDDLTAQVQDARCPLDEQDKQAILDYLREVTEKITQAAPKRAVQPWGFGHGPESAPPAPAPESENGWGPKGPHFGAPIAPPPAEQPPYRSNRLKALFKHAPHGAEIVSLLPGSPLAGRLNPGDIITALDGVPVNSTWELENHYSVTKVDFMDSRGQERHKVIRIRP